MICHRRTILLFLAVIPALLYCIADGYAQPQDKQVIGYKVIGRDTVFVDELPPAVIHPRQYMTRREYKDFYRRLHNFSKAYPYAVFVSRTIKQTDSLFLADGYSKRQKNRYLSKFKSELLDDFKPILRTLTLKQGLMMIRLIDREVGLTPYYIIRRYFNGATAGFWQGVAKLYKGSLKQPYDKFGQDKDLEEFVQMWERGEFDDYYLWIFGRPMPEIVIPEKYR
ncbi:MAG: DUF4294 domain-containing protein [Bacteroidales bacterium]|nr:DUF4294 domain-containing protein [Candidatus Cacconaster caballi]